LESTLSLTIRRVRLGELHQDPANARQHGERNMEAIRGSLTRFGQAEPLVVQKRSGRVIGGNGRLQAMLELGWTECDVVEVDLDDVQATALGIALNRAGDLADWNLPALGSLLESLQASDALDGVGFSQKELDEVLSTIINAGDALGEIAQDEVPAPPDAATSRTGSLPRVRRKGVAAGGASRSDADPRILRRSRTIQCS
jgi:ParB-like chromosome segregation protein Spo0J